MIWHNFGLQRDSGLSFLPEVKTRKTEKTGITALLKAIQSKGLEKTPSNGLEKTQHIDPQTHKISVTINVFHFLINNILLQLHASQETAAQTTTSSCTQRLVISAHMGALCTNSTPQQGRQSTHTHSCAHAQRKAGETNFQDSMLFR